MRRDSLGVKGMRRVSNLRDGAPAYPHAEVPDDVLYRHCSDQAPPVVRMKNLLSWMLHRSVRQALGEEPLPRLRKRGSARTEGGGRIDAMLERPNERTQRALTEEESQRFAEAAPIIRRVVEETLRDLNDGLIGISWLRQSKVRALTGHCLTMQGKEDKVLQPHPRNESNAHAAGQLEKMLSQLRTELDSWHAQEAHIARIEHEADQLEQIAARTREKVARSKSARGRSSTSGERDTDEDAAVADEVERVLRGGGSLAPAEDDHTDEMNALSWTYDELDDSTRQHLDYARATLDAAAELNDAVAEQRRVSECTGTELDERIPELELNVDKIHARLQPFVQLAELAQRYLQSVSSRAAHALQERTAAGLATFSGADARVAGQSEDAQHQQRLDALLAGIHDSHDTGATSGAASDVAVDAKDILRALTRTN